MLKCWIAISFHLIAARSKNLNRHMLVHLFCYDELWLPEKTSQTTCLINSWSLPQLGLSLGQGKVDGVRSIVCTYR